MKPLKTRLKLLVLDGKPLKIINFVEKKEARSPRFKISKFGELSELSNRVKKYLQR